MTEGTCKDGLQVKRLDRTRPPPGYTLTPSCGVWVADERGELIREDESFDDEASAIAAARAHYEVENDPPGLQTWNEAEGPPGGVWMIGVLGESGHFADYRSQAEARADAWAHYWRRVAVSLDLDGENGPAESWPERCAWPLPLTWPDEQVSAVERWLAEGGELPEVLRA